MMDLSTSQELIGRVAFWAQFFDRGRARLNSAYACLVAAEHLHLLQKQVMMS